MKHLALLLIALASFTAKAETYKGDLICEKNFGSYKVIYVLNEWTGLSVYRDSGHNMGIVVLKSDAQNNDLGGQSFSAKYTALSGMLESDNQISFQIRQSQNGRYLKVNFHRGFRRPYVDLKPLLNENIPCTNKQSVTLKEKS